MTRQLVVKFLADKCELPLVRRKRNRHHTMHEQIRLKNHKISVPTFSASNVTRLKLVSVLTNQQKNVSVKKRNSFFSSSFGIVLLYKPHLTATEVQESTNCHNFGHNHSVRILQRALHAIRAPAKALILPSGFAFRTKRIIIVAHSTIRGARRKIERTEPTGF